MYRVYRLIDGQRFYWLGGFYWSEYVWQAKPLSLAQAQQVAQQVAQSEDGHLERLCGSKRR